MYSVKEIMTQDVITVSPGSSLRDVGRILREKKISGLPVVDKNGALVGIITLTDMLKMLDRIYYRRKGLEGKGLKLEIAEIIDSEKANEKVENLMTKDVFTLDESSTIGDVMRIMFRENVHTIPIVNGAKLVGIVGKRDLIYACF